MDIHITKPILKWIGGKTQIIHKIIYDFPKEINNYHEPFLGGGSVLLSLLSFVKHNHIKINGNIYAYDLNEPLIYVYKNIQSYHNELFNTLQSFIDDFKKCENDFDKEKYYYHIRDKYNNLSTLEKNNILGSSLFIFLNKTCFRGMFRISKNGFNVPYGHYKNPEIINKNHLDEIHLLIQNVIFECKDYNLSLSHINDNDFIYIDPPYVPEKNTSFVSYTEYGFNLENHINLFNLIHVLTQRKIKIMLNNADVNIVRENFTNDNYHLFPILCKRTINSKKPNSKTNELIIKNY
jgi:DNA adenine methylase